MGGAAFDESRTFCSQLNDCSLAVKKTGSRRRSAGRRPSFGAILVLKLMQRDGGVERARLLRKGAEDDNIASAGWA